MVEDQAGGAVLLKPSRRNRCSARALRTRTDVPHVNALNCLRLPRTKQSQGRLVEEVNLIADKGRVETVQTSVLPSLI